ncbi:MAG: hypothetical protein QCH35_05805 [Methanomicrobiaceae archaeon]|nr:hypothetical protein [Methanomicrobiaceae archaeon]
MAGPEYITIGKYFYYYSNITSPVRYLPAALFDGRGMGILCMAVRCTPPMAHEQRSGVFCQDGKNQEKMGVSRHAAPFIPVHQDTGALL